MNAKQEIKKIKKIYIPYHEKCINEIHTYMEKYRYHHKRKIQEFEKKIKQLEMEMM